MRKLFALALLLAFAGTARATTVTGTVQDANGNAYAAGDVTFFLPKPSSGVTPTVSGAPITNVTGYAVDANGNYVLGPFNLNSSGAFSVTVQGNDVITPASTTYNVRIRGKSVNLGPGAAIVPIDYRVSAISITGSSQSISTQLQAAAPLIGPKSGSSSAPVYPVTVTGGVSGGIPCFTSTTTEAASALLTAGQDVIGGGAGMCPTTGSFNDNGAGVITGPNVQFQIQSGSGQDLVIAGDSASAHSVKVFSNMLFPGYLMQDTGGGTKFTIDTSAGSAQFAKYSAIPVAVGSLPAASSNGGQWRTVNDSTTVVAEGQSCVGSGAVTALAFSNGTVWKCF